MDRVGLNRERARSYRNAVTASEGCEFQEIGFRLTEGSVHAPVYARSQVGRYLGLLAHSVAGLDIECISLPSDLPEDFRFVPYGPSARLLYSLLGLSLFGFQPEIYSQIISCLAWSFKGESEEELTRLAIEASGCLFALRAITTSHSTAIDWLLDPQTPNRLEIDLPRSLHRARQTFSKFWGFDLIFDDPARLKLILKKLSVETIQPELPSELRPPSFAQYYSSVCSFDDNVDKTT